MILNFKHWIDGFWESLESEVGSNFVYKSPNFQEITGAGGRTIWGDPADVGKILEGEVFDAVLDNNGKDLDAVRFVFFPCSNTKLEF